MNNKITCPVEGIDIRQMCPVTTCMWNSKTHKEVLGCLAQKTDPKHLPDYVFAKAKQIPLSEVARLKRKNKERIYQVVLLFKYFQFLHSRQNKNQFPENAKIRKYIRKLVKLLRKRPFDAPYCKWTVELLYMALQRDNYEEFMCEEDVQRDYPLYKLFWISKADMAELTYIKHRIRNVLKKLKLEENFI